MTKYWYIERFLSLLLFSYFETKNRRKSLTLRLLDILDPAASITALMDLKNSMLYDEISKIFWHSFCGRKKTVLKFRLFWNPNFKLTEFGSYDFSVFLFYSHLHNTYFSCVHFNSGWYNTGFQKFAIHISWTVDTSKAQLLRHIRFFDYKFYI